MSLFKLSADKFENVFRTMAILDRLKKRPDSLFPTSTHTTCLMLDESLFKNWRRLTKFQFSVLYALDRSIDEI